MMYFEDVIKDMFLGEQEDSIFNKNQLFYFLRFWV